MTVLVLAEDDDDIRAIMARTLQRAGYTVIEAVDGAAGLQAVREHHPDGVVTDIDMPNMTGVDLCLELRAGSATQNLPVIFISGTLMPGDPRPGDAQATALLRKPFLPRELLDCVQKALHQGHHDGLPPFVCP